MRQGFRRRRGEPTITLINVVFLLLAFFIVAGTIAAPPPVGIRLLSLPGDQLRPPADSVVLDRNGTTIWPEGVADAAGMVAQLPPEAEGVVRVTPDRESAAQDLVALVRDLAAAGAADVRLVAQRRAVP